MLGPLFVAFAERDVAAYPVVYADEALDEVRAEVLGFDGLLVWVNPIQDGATRARLDGMLREAVDAGVWVSARPDVIDKMGTKEVLFTTRTLGWGTDTAVYRSPAELDAGFPTRLGTHGRLVVKQARGTGGNGVWRVELRSEWSGGTPGWNTPVLVQRSDPRHVTPLEAATLGGFLEECRPFFAWSACLIDQPYQARVGEGMIRAYLVHDEVVGFCHQHPKGLLTPGAPDDSTTPPVTPAMEDPHAAAYRSLRASIETDWVPALTRLLGMTTEELPVIWDADFLLGHRTAAGDDTYVLCEINVQAVWPYPPQASGRVAQAALDRVLHARTA